MVAFVTTGINYSYEYEYYDNDFVRMTDAFQTFTAVGISVLVILAVVGNAVTIAAFLTDRKLQTVYDFYIFNLAITDLLIGCISMPFYAVYTIKEFYWDFGVTFCKIWLTVDFTLCLESIILILVLSYDRLELVTLGPHYSTRCTKQRARVAIAISWFCAFLLYGPAILTWDYWVGHSAVEPYDCDVEFAQNFEFTTVTAVIEFVIPVVSVGVLNFLIYLKIRKRLQKVHESPKKTVDDSTIPTPYSVFNVNAFKSNDTSLRLRENKVQFEINQKNSEALDFTFRFCRKSNKKRTRDRNQIASRDSKAARFLIVLVIVFLATWAPYTILTIIVSFCDTCVNTSLYEAMSWLLWAKSAVNPFIYAFNSTRYRYNFKRLLCGRKKSKRIHPENVEVTCHTGMS